MLIPVDNLGQHGLMPDPRPEMLPYNAWSSGKNVRPYNGVMQVVNGEQEVYSGFVGAPKFVMPWIDQGALYWLYAGDAFIGRVTGTVHTDISIVGGYNASDTAGWVGAILGGVPIMTNGSWLDKPQEWHAASGKMQNLSNFLVNDYAKVVRAFGQRLVALGIKRSTTEYPHMIKWSGVAAPGTVPASWDHTDPTTGAGERDLAQTNGELVDCLPLGRQLAVYKEDSIYVMTLVGGQNVMDTHPSPIRKGLLSRDCMVEIDGGHFAVGFGEVYVHNLQTVQPILEGRARDWFFNEMNPDYAHMTWVAKHTIKKEVWVGFVSSTGGLTYPDRVGIWNWKENTWTIRDLNEVTHAAEGFIEGTAAVIDGMDQPIDGYTQTFHAKTYTISEPKLLGCSPTQTDFVQLEETSKFEAANIDFFLERLDLPLSGVGRDGTPKLDPGTRKLMTRFYPKMKGNGTVNIYFGGKEDIDSPVQWQGPFAFEIGVDKFVDPMLNYVYFCLRIEGSNVPGFSISGYRAEVKVIGENTL